MEVDKLKSMFHPACVQRLLADKKQYSGGPEGVFTVPRVIFCRIPSSVELRFTTRADDSRVVGPASLHTPSGRWTLSRAHKHVRRYESPLNVLRLFS